MSEFVHGFRAGEHPPVSTSVEECSRMSVVVVVVVVVVAFLSNLRAAAL
jgi:hypothetical protein